ncbi:MAG: M56 family metallopeptidase [Clostridiaceae bacterium]|nr:M56 family metallopeptidase [Clostridiaceae bacterium]
MVFFLLPIIAPALWLISPEGTVWVYGYKVACTVWMLGCAVFCLFHIVRSIFALYALKSYNICTDEHINRIYNDCISRLGLKKAPVLYCGTLSEPACVIAFLRPAVIINEAIIRQLPDKEIEIVFFHELIHIRRKHHIYQRIFDVVCIIHWFNPFARIIKNDFSEHCEMDCDQYVLSFMGNSVSQIEYSKTILHLLELSSYYHKPKSWGINAVGYMLAERRMRSLFREYRPAIQKIGVIVFVLSIGLTIFTSIHISRSYFYPYPAYSTKQEYITFNNT